MFRFIIPAAAAFVLMASPALAGHCPVDVKKIDEAMGTVELSTADMTKVKTLRDAGEAAHNEGKHGESLKALHEAMKIMGVKH